MVNHEGVKNRTQKINFLEFPGTYQKQPTRPLEGLSAYQGCGEITLTRGGLNESFLRILVKW